MLMCTLPCSVVNRQLWKSKDLNTIFPPAEKVSALVRARHRHPRFQTTTLKGILPIGRHREKGTNDIPRLKGAWSAKGTIA